MKDLDIRDLITNGGVEIKREVVTVFRKQYLLVWITNTDSVVIEIFDGTSPRSLFTVPSAMSVEDIKHVIAVYSLGYSVGYKEGQRDACK